jgi:hypothetical protein
MIGTCSVCGKTDVELNDEGKCADCADTAHTGTDMGSETTEGAA